MGTQLIPVVTNNKYENRKAGILLLTSYPPRACGIATYSMDLLHAMQGAFGESVNLSVCALENKVEERDYPEEVRYSLNAHDVTAFIRLASQINRDPSIDAVYIQHEFGLFGGARGYNALLFMNLLQKPCWIAFHTVLPNPDHLLHELIVKITDVATGVVVMTQTSADILVRDYGIQGEKLTVIHHGTHLVPFPNREKVKQEVGLENRLVLSTFGLISRGKSIETAIEAMPEIVKQFPEALYLVIGATHPEIVRQEGEEYRTFLENRVEALGLGQHVRFINAYQTREELLQYLQATDIYLFVSNDPNQAVSGTFAYAMSCSCAVISTPIPHALEMLQGDAGKIVDFGASAQVAQAVIHLFEQPEERKRMSLNALHRIRPTAWENSALAHLELFQKTLKFSHEVIYSMPKVSMAHLKKMTTSKGMLQFSEISHPDPSSGYTLDDNARALIVATWHGKLYNSKRNQALIATYLDFIQSMQLPDGSFMNYADKTGGFDQMNHKVNLEDANGRVIWGLGVFLSHAAEFHVSLGKRARAMLEKALPTVTQLSSPRAMAFAIKGLFAANIGTNSMEINAQIAQLGSLLMQRYQQASDKDWKWFESNLTYANSVLPEAMMYTWLTTNDPDQLRVAVQSFDFLIAKIFDGDMIRPISKRDWKCKGADVHRSGEQPVDVAYTILGLNLFHHVCGGDRYLKKMEHAFNWFLGKNHLHQIIYNPSTGGCYDGLEQDHVNLNQGAESTICYLMARLTMEEALRKQDVRPRLRLPMPQKVQGAYMERRGA